MSRKQTDEKLINYSVFHEGKTFLGTATVQLPTLEMNSETLKGAGIAGDLSSITPGHFGALSVTLNWNNRPSQEIIKLMRPQLQMLEFREAVHVTDRATNEYKQIGKKIIIRGIPKKFDLGKLEPSTKVDSSTELETNYIKYMDGGRTLIELDKINNIYVVDGVDYLANVRSLLGL